jgi:hypothetical protein
MAWRRRRARCGDAVPWRREAGRESGRKPRRFADDGAIARIDDEDFGGLRAAIDA